ncbi:MAG: tyrosine--tRNA ligase [Acidimicrobiales bacterium]
MTSADILDDLAARGLIHDTTDMDSLRARLRQDPVVVYAGFDPTADSLHVGNLVPLLLLRRFQLYGHLPVALAGGATGMIGDPGGRSSERTLLDAESLDENLAAIKPQLEMLLDFTAGDTQARLVDNRDWTASIGVLDFLRDVGKHVTVNTMLAKDSIKTRVESDAGISFTEFSYMLLQANDFHHLFRTLNVELQVGGSDQWGNITAGIDLVRRKEGAHVFGLTVPLVTRADGQKFGKSAEGAIWLSPERTTPYAFFQYFMNVEDSDVERFLLQMTLLAVDEIALVMAQHRLDPGQRTAQQALAHAVTALVHGEAEATRAAGASVGFTRSAQELSARDWAELASSLPTLPVLPSDLGTELVEFLTLKQALASRSDGRRLIAQSGLSLNDEAVIQGQLVRTEDFSEDGYAMVRRGKKHRFILHLLP